MESCTGIVEHYDGRLELIRWVERDEEAPVSSLPRRALPRPAIGADRHIAA